MYIARIRFDSEFRGKEKDYPMVAGIKDKSDQLTAQPLSVSTTLDRLSFVNIFS